jgi:hypothetical protein
VTNLTQAKPSSLAARLAKPRANDARLEYRERVDEVVRKRDAGDR